MKYFLKLGILCLLAATLAVSCKPEKEPEEPGVIDKPGDEEPGIDTSSVANYTETLSDINFTMEMIGVQGGTFDMGATPEQEDEAKDNEKPLHKVTLSSYHIGKYEITKAQYDAVMGTNQGDDEDYPMANLTWNEAQAFCDSLSKKTGKKYALPTEAQWEYAARGGKKSKDCKYSGSNNIDEVAWYWENSAAGTTRHSTQPVGSKMPNELGIYDMSGNVWEWCFDRYGKYRGDAVTNPTGPRSGTTRIVRGGGWDGVASYCRVSDRRDYFLNERNADIGFRVVCLP